MMANQTIQMVHQYY